MKKIWFKDKQIDFFPSNHISKEKADDIISLIKNEKYDAVLIELDKDRAEQLRFPHQYEEIKTKNIINFLAKKQKHLARRYDTNIGIDMLSAIEISEELNIPIFYIDQHINITSKKMKQIPISEKIKLIVSALVSQLMFRDDDIHIHNIHELISEQRKLFPQLMKILLDDRNAHMSREIIRNPYDHILVIVGAAHVDGIIELIKKTP